MIKLLSEDSFEYRRLKSMYDIEDSIWYLYDEGGYLNTSNTTYYDGRYGKILETKNHGSYG